MGHAVQPADGTALLTGPHLPLLRRAWISIRDTLDLRCRALPDVLRRFQVCRQACGPVAGARLLIVQPTATLTRLPDVYLKS
jgi:hypothetical protein